MRSSRTSAATWTWSPVRYTPKLADLVPTVRDDAQLGPAGWSGYFGFDHAIPATSNVDFRRALAHAVDRDALEHVVPDNMVVATGGVVPPALQGHTPDIVPRFDPDEARRYLDASGVTERSVTIGGIETWVGTFLQSVADTWHDVLGLDVRVESWTLERALTLKNIREVAPDRLHRAGCPDTPIPSTSCGCSSSRTARRTKAGSRIRRSTS